MKTMRDTASMDRGRSPHGGPELTVAVKSVGTCRRSAVQLDLRAHFGRQRHRPKISTYVVVAFVLVPLGVEKSGLSDGTLWG